VDVLERLYNGAIRQVDDAIGRLHRELDERGLIDDSYLAVTSDHGEEFLEHGGVKHSGQLHSELVDVPLIISGPKVSERVVEEPVQLLDLAPTLLNIADVSVPDQYLGNDHSATIQGQTAATSSSPVISETPAANEERLVSVRNHDFTYIRNCETDNKMLFDRDADPSEQHNICEEYPSVTRDLNSVVKEHIEFVAENRIANGERSEDVSPDIKQQLANLGYK
jgi:arylsulfatase A-like enzyme